MLKRSLIFTLLFLQLLNANANLKDSINYYLKHYKPELIGGLSSRNTFIGTYKTSVSGLSAGYDFGEKVRFLGGVYWLTKPIKERVLLNEATPQQYWVNESSTFWYLGVTGDYTFYKQGRWELDVPVRIGLGTSIVKQFDDSPQKLFINKNSTVILPIETGVGAFYRINWWIGVSGGLGSRIVIGKNTSKKYSGTYYSLGLVIFFGEIYSHIRKDMKENPVPKTKKKPTKGKFSLN